MITNTSARNISSIADSFVKWVSVFSTIAAVSGILEVASRSSLIFHRDTISYSSGAGPSKSVGPCSAARPEPASHRPYVRRLKRGKWNKVTLGIMFWMLIDILRHGLNQIRSETVAVHSRREFRVNRSSALTWHWTETRASPAVGTPKREGV